jgi:PAS domain S-box-containing protein
MPTIKEDEERLRLLESVILNTTDGILIAENSESLDYQIIFVNESFIKMSGYIKEDIIGRSPLDFFVADPSGNELNKLKDAINRCEPCNIVLKNRRKNGESYWINISAAPVSDGVGGYKHWVYIQRDVNDRRRHLQAMEEQNKRLKEIAWIQSHVVRAPLARIMGLVDLLSEQNNKDEINNTEIIEAIASSANELDEIIRKIVQHTESVQNQSQQ